MIAACSALPSLHCNSIRVFRKSYCASKTGTMLFLCQLLLCRGKYRGPRIRERLRFCCSTTQRENTEDFVPKGSSGAPENCKHVHEAAAATIRTPWNYGSQESLSLAKAPGQDKHGEIGSHCATFILL